MYLFRVFGVPHLLVERFVQHLQAVDLSPDCGHDSLAITKVSLGCHPRGRGEKVSLEEAADRCLRNSKLRRNLTIAVLPFDERGDYLRARRQPGYGALSTHDLFSFTSYCLEASKDLDFGSL